MRDNRTLVLRLAAKIDRRGPDECWPWTASTNDNGYPQIAVPRPKKMALAARVLWELVHGRLPSHIGICHTCDSPPCMNMRHWFPGTQQQNLADMRVKGRWSVTKIGTLHHNHKLDAKRVRTMRLMRDSGRAFTEIAEHFGVCTRTVRAVVARRTWRHVTDYPSPPDIEVSGLLPIREFGVRT